MQFSAVNTDKADCFQVSKAELVPPGQCQEAAVSGPLLSSSAHHWDFGDSQVNVHL